LPSRAFSTSEACETEIMTTCGMRRCRFSASSATDRKSSIWLILVSITRSSDMMPSWMASTTAMRMMGLAGVSSEPLLLKAAVGAAARAESEMGMHSDT